MGSGTGPEVTSMDLEESMDMGVVEAMEMGMAISTASPK